MWTIRNLQLSSHHASQYINLCTCRGTDFDDTGDVLVDADCQHTGDMAKLFGSKRHIRLHTGFHRAWESVAQTILPFIEKQLEQVSGSLRCGM